MAFCTIDPAHIPSGAPFLFLLHGWVVIPANPEQKVKLENTS
jgi:hypothetical protein